MQAPICSVVSQDPPAKTKVHTQKIANEIIVLQALRHTIGNTAFLLKSQGKLPKQPVKTYPVLEQFAVMRTIYLPNKEAITQHLYEYHGQAAARS